MSSNNNDINYEGIVQDDMPAILQAIDVVMKYTRHKGDNMALKDVETHIDALMKFSTFTFVSLSKLIDIELAKDCDISSVTRNVKEIDDVLKRIYS